MSFEHRLLIMQIVGLLFLDNNTRVLCYIYKRELLTANHKTIKCTWTWSTHWGYVNIQL